MWCSSSIVIRVELRRVGSWLVTRLRCMMMWWSSPTVLDRRGLRLWWGSPVVGLLGVLGHTDRGSRCRCRGSRRCSPSTVARCSRGVTETIAGWSTPLIHHWSIATTVRIVSRFSSLDLHLLVLDVDIVF